jgi:hypothetical protein
MKANTHQEAPAPPPPNLQAQVDGAQGPTGNDSPPPGAPADPGDWY